MPVKSGTAVHTCSVKQAVELLYTKTLYFVSKVSLRARRTLNRQTDGRECPCVRRCTDSGMEIPISVLLQPEVSGFLMRT
jgi:hypothetical protein